MKRIATIFLFFTHVVVAQKVPDLLTHQISSSVFSLSQVMMHDVVNPPAASRYYAYCMLGPYEIISQNNTTLPPLPTFIKDYKSIPITIISKYNAKVAAVYCILETGKLMLPSGYILSDDEEKFLASLRQYKIDTAVINASVSVAKEVASRIVAFSRTDHYNELSAKIRYRPVRDDAHWYPTPPTYMEAVEPHWKTIRPMIIDSCNEFIPKSALAFSKDSSSLFYNLAKEVYDISKSATKEQLEVAAFWDCNPFAVSTAGHMSIGFKKISPGGHWMSIAGIATDKAHLSFDKAILLNTVLSVTLMDAFISCWDEKYRSNRIRPETYINRYINARWEPLLQTPPFPEYPSGHSVISVASAEVLTYLLGDNFNFTDDSERLFELPSRSFKSFRLAANEAAISRLYGGIHFRDAIENGQQMGLAISAKIISKIKKAGVGKIKL
ncbi:vanadium-dependent haloperoxidase [Segetibacter koreensis]|uniref:vanadium-dependent haloperoxidase n=1 Tax=Segetibacter koreensis TaxID=398037 RepID=UPI000364360C|nr:vanadium-dependent haloperoxidase [Segetibacter koreensis]